MWWGYVSFKGSMRVPRFFKGNDVLLQYVDAPLWKFLDDRNAFRFQVGQLVVQEVECNCCAVKKNVIIASQLYDVADVGYCSQ